MDAVTIISPPAGAPNSLLVLIRPEVHAASLLPAAPCPRTMMSRLPRPSRCTLYGDDVIVSISPVPKLPRPVSKFQLPTLKVLSAGPLKSSAQTSLHGGGRAGVSDA